jgi:hypothetical protein
MWPAVVNRLFETKTCRFIWQDFASVPNIAIFEVFFTAAMIVEQKEMWLGIRGTTVSTSNIYFANLFIETRRIATRVRSGCTQS